jgi:Zn-dependent protease with chaperone function
MAFDSITQFQQCISTEEKKGRASVTLVNVVIWLFLIFLTTCSFGALLLVAFVGWLLRSLFAEYNVRKLQALGTTASPDQFPAVAEAVTSVCERFNFAKRPRVIVLSSGETNAFAMKFARKRVMVILSELLEGIIERPEEVRALVAHEMCHNALDHGPRGVFEIYKSARYKAGRELTCDNAGLVAAENLDSAKTLIKKLCVGPKLYDHLSDRALITEAGYLYSGFVGWLLRGHLTHPPAGARLENLDRFWASAEGGRV